MIDTLRDKIIETPSWTRDGLLAKAAALKASLPLNYHRTEPSPLAQPQERLAWSLCEDILLMLPSSA